MDSRKCSSPQRRVSQADVPSRPALEEQTLKTDHVQIERKNFVFALKENLRGRFLRITEDAHGRRDRIIIPAPGLAEFRKALDEMVRASAEAPQETGTTSTVDQ
jgi:hypothetical protein